MHCPNCGTQAIVEQKFCRACGLDLQAISQLVAKQFCEQPSRTPIPSEAEQVARMVWRLIFGGCIGFGGAGLLALDKKFDAGTLPIEWLGGLLVLSGILFAFYAVFAPLLRPPKAVCQIPRPAALPVAETTSKLVLESGVELMGSVTEHTTRTLEPVAAKSGDLS